MVTEFRRLHVSNGQFNAISIEEILISAQTYHWFCYCCARETLHTSKRTSARGEMGSIWDIPQLLARKTTGECAGHEPKRT